jgi:hydrogenase expression/formation protein HypC
MCVSVPGTVVEVRGPAALIDTAGIARWCNALLQPGLEPGDHVLVHAGIVVDVLTPERAREIEDICSQLGVLASQQGRDRQD